MRPSAEEQLQGTCRVLEKVVSPCVTDPYARTILEGLIGNLRMLAGALPAVPAFLASDNRSTAALLGQLQAAVEGRNHAVPEARSRGEDEIDAGLPVRLLEVRLERDVVRLADGTIHRDRQFG